MTVRPISADELIDLRHRVLRAALPRESAIFDGDLEPTTAHVGAFDDEGRLVGCVTLVRRPTPEGAAAWQLRGMAVDAEHRQSGVGAALLRALDAHVAGSDGPRQLWCNARVPAVGFYERHGWRVASETFEIPTAGPHRVMTKACRATASDDRRTSTATLNAGRAFLS